MSKVSSATCCSTYSHIIAPETKAKWIPAGTPAAQTAFIIRKITIILGLGITVFGTGLMIGGIATCAALGTGVGFAIVGATIGFVGFVLTTYAAAGYNLSKTHAMSKIEINVEEQPTEYERKHLRLKSDLGEVTQ